MVFKVTLLALGLICLSGASALKCRNGFDMTMNNMPMNYWNETFTCSSATDQSCFITEVKYSPDLLQGESVTVYYGSCVSTANESYLECDQVNGNEGTGADQISNLFPDLSDQIGDVVMVFAEQIAKQINESVANFDRTEFIKELLAEYNITVPDNVEEILQELQNNSTNVSMLLENLFEMYLNSTLQILEEINMTISQKTKIFNLTLKANDITREEFKNMLKERYPGLASYLKILSSFEDGEIIELSAEFFAWLTDPNKNLTTLTSLVNETIYLVLERNDINIRDVFEELLNPDSCRHNTCATDSCNLPEILVNESTTAAQTTTAPPTVPTTTTSGTEAVVTTAASTALLLATVFLSLNRFM